ncbi:hypothetical protein GS441_02460 [Rhodococcus hoagii]|uniref:Orc1-like AAA ATPase domain-containing protein n=1 Tax=Rhodococcus hoagii TaxID=43767 RepID=A0A9Q2P2M7_RHOHA|nr:hypothetical protein [Prescottella equi]
MADVDTLGPHQASGPSPGHGRLPADLTSFVGRRHELTAVRGALTECRLVTLTGIGGVGKTRLALRVATSVRRNFPDGVWLIELADVHDPDFVVDVVATTLGVRDYTGRPPRDSLVEAMPRGPGSSFSTIANRSSTRSRSWSRRCWSGAPACMSSPRAGNCSDSAARPSFRCPR